MSRVVIVKGEDNKLHGLGEKSERAWSKWRKTVEAMVCGETLEFTWNEPRSKKHHGLFFVQLKELHARQEQFEDPQMLRTWLTVGAGYCTFAPGPTGRMVALPQSIAWHAMDEADFGELHLAVNAFLRTEHATRFLWPHLESSRATEAIEALLSEFEL